MKKSLIVFLLVFQASLLAAQEPGLDTPELQPLAPVLEATIGKEQTIPEKSSVDRSLLNGSQLRTNVRLTQKSKAEEILVNVFENQEALQNYLSTLSENMEPTEVDVLKISHQVGSNGELRQVRVSQRVKVDPRSKELTPEEVLGYATYYLDKKIRATRDSAADAADADTAKLLAELRQVFIQRFHIETQYHDFKVKQVEKRAEKLREEVLRRQKAREEWADAMVTLTKMQVEGIDMPGEMHAIVPPKASREFAVPLRSLSSAEHFQQSFSTREHPYRRRLSAGTRFTARELTGTVQVLWRNTLIVFCRHAVITAALAKAGLPMLGRLEQ